MEPEDILDIDPDESVLFHVRQHPIMAWFIILGGAALSLIVLVGFVTTIESLTPGTSSEVKNALAISTFVFIIFVMLGTFTFVWVHRENELIVTDQNVIQKLQFGIFSSRTSQLNLAKLQDVTVNQHGILAEIFNYGTIELETAGEADNYKFKYAPSPNIYAKRIIEAHEDYVIDIGQQSNRI